MNPERIVFFHIPKCAGTSVEDAFAELYGENNIFKEKTIIDYLMCNPADVEKNKVLAGHITHDTAQCYINNNTLLITLLRNPISRIRSVYNYHYNLNDESLLYHLARENKFGDWLECNIPEILIHIENAVVRQFCPESFWNPILAACPDLIIQTAINFLDKFHVIGIVEEMELFQLSLMNYNINLKLNTLNKSHSDETKNISNSELKKWYLKKCELEYIFLSKIKVFEKIIKDLDAINEK